MNVFSTIWDTPSKDLLVSFDGLSFHLPPEVTRRGYFRNNIWLHTDQSYITSEFKCAQGMITLRDCNDGDATLCMREGSHLLHKEFGQKFNLLEIKNLSNSEAELSNGRNVVSITLVDELGNINNLISNEMNKNTIFRNRSGSWHLVASGTVILCTKFRKLSCGF